MNKLFNIISSMKLTASLLTIFAVSVGVATFIESDFSTQTAQAEVYSAFWFEVLLALLGLNLISSMIKNSMLSVKKWNVVLFHSSFLVILIGAAVTRFAGYEGSMHIREGESENRITSRETYIQAVFTSDNKKNQFKKSILLSEISENNFDEDVKVKGENVNITLLEYIPNASYELVEDKENGITILDMMISMGGQGKAMKLKQGEYIESEDLVLNFGADVKTDKKIVNITYIDGKLHMSNPLEFQTLDMGTKNSATLAISDDNEFRTRMLYQSEKTNFVLKSVMESVSEKLVSKSVKGSRNRLQDALKMQVSYKGKKKELTLIGSSGAVGYEKVAIFDGLEVELSYGAVIRTIPFSLKLIDFELERYPGSMSPASYASEVILIDKADNVETPYRIYMNHILDYKSFRFFQSSYDKDEQGTVLSVNNDPGTLPTYIGYIMLAIGMFSQFFMSNGRFRKLMKKGRKYADQRNALASALIAVALIFSASPSEAKEVNELVKAITSFDKDHAAKFGQLISQDSSGRMKPLNTLNVEIVNKVHGGTIAGMTADQMVLGMMVRPEAWKEINLIKIRHKGINEILGTDENNKFASFSQFLEVPERMQGYKLQEAISNAVAKDPAHRNKLDKELLKVDERFNIVYMVFTGSVFKLFPRPGDVGNKWYATIEALQSFKQENALKVREVAVQYFTGIESSLKTGDWSTADTAIAEVAKYQKFYGADVYPSQNKVAAEIFYNKYNVFEKLMPYYLLMGILLLVLSFVQILAPRFKLDMFSKGATGLLIVFFLLHSIGLLMRWYISGHAPWSNGYESMIYIAWATVLAGFIFSRQSVITLAATGILAGIILFVAHLNWMDPQVTNLVPVLKSYWLSIHVSMITASYGFLALGALLGFIVLLLFAMRTKGNEKRINLAILEINTINEMGLIVGLVLLTVGNFLGGVWANESWGRYWGWDPKETWALVSILLYAVVIHLRFIKALYTPFNYAVASVLVFSSIIMTYFGVNYYLAGMHSYAKGDPVPVPDFVPWTYAVIFLLIVIAARNRKIA
ncbi:cytochrome c biogenesis protein CcsA [Sulfurimonas sp. MAG313]|nr:cytochrome c biogenesis protein CcsA [Sulfurimonas sp. MAG313]MDF1879998.1 cytochrome c biogenesis protein CcsA [Sulfurimonas sp. MAG313]